MTEKLHIFISLVAGIIFTAYALIKDFELFFWIKNVTIIIVVFYILGLITRNYIQMVMSTPKEERDITVEEVELDDEENENIEGNNSPEGNRTKRKFDFNRDDE